MGRERERKKWKNNQDRERKRESRCVTMLFKKTWKEGEGDKLTE